MFTVNFSKIYFMNIKLILIVFYFLTTQNLPGQIEEWGEISFDENMSFKFPFNYDQRDTLGHKIFSKDVDEFQTIIASSFTSTNYDHSSIQLLEEGYKKYLLGISDQLPNLNIIKSELITVDGLLCQNSAVEFEFDSSKQLLETIVTFIGNKTYTLQIVSILEEGPIHSKISINDLLDSVDFGNLSKQNQLKAVINNQKRNQGKMIGYLLLGLIGIGIFIIQAIKRRSKIGELDFY